MTAKQAVTATVRKNYGAYQTTLVAIRYSHVIKNNIEIPLDTEVMLLLLLLLLFIYYF